MVSVLLRLRSSGILNEFPNLAVYVARGEARAAYKRAFDAQLAFIPMSAKGGRCYHLFGSMISMRPCMGPQTLVALLEQ
ncbi:MAG TPA: hypothetical protein VN882_00420 [Steroidobacteraceae bacterium]|jgi:hypothetical protein|nr:hypothetical protein [Steroidobacteraceae bacterium]